MVDIKTVMDRQVVSHARPANIRTRIVKPVVKTAILDSIKMSMERQAVKGVAKESMQVAVDHHALIVHLAGMGRGTMHTILASAIIVVGVNIRIVLGKVVVKSAVLGNIKRVRGKPAVIRARRVL